MMHKTFALVCFFLIVFHFHPSFAQDELSLDDSLTSSPAVDDGVIPPDTSELNLDSPMDASMDPASPLDTIVETSTPIEESPQTAMQTVTDPIDQAENVNLASSEELLMRDNALYGFSVGLMVTSLSLHEKYRVNSQYPIPNPDKNRETAAIQSAGIILRYAIIPYYSLGTDLNISYLKSQNHSSITVNNTRAMSEVNSLKGELNFTYAINVGGHFPIYFLAGVGAEKLTGGTIEDMIEDQGYGGQIGGGFVVASKINLEALYSYYEHRLSQKIQEGYALETLPGDVNTESTRTKNQGLILRGTMSF